MSDVLAPTAWQSHVLSTPLDADLALLGGRGGGKSYGLAWLILQHAQEYGPHAAILYVRREWSGLRDFEKILFQLIYAAYPDATYNLKEHIWRLPNGASIELTQCTTIEQSYSKLQGRSFTMIAVDETGQYFDFSVVDTLKSNLRGPKGVKVRHVIAGNPNGPLHQQILKRYIRKLTPWAISSLENVSERLILCPSTYRDNDQINRDAYAKSLIQSSANDAGRLAAWLDGDWEAGISDLFFSSVWDDDRVLIPPFQKFPSACKPYISLDWGTMRPAYCGLFGAVRKPVAIGNRHFGAKSVILIDETHTARGEDLNAGDLSTVEDFAVEVLKMWQDNGLFGRPNGVADDSMWIRHGGRGTASLADQFKQCGIDLRRANKGMRRGGWEVMRSMLSKAGSGEAAMYFAENCQYALQTIPFLARDTRRSDDLNTNQADHAADAVRYAILGAGVVQKRLIGSYYDGRKAYEMAPAGMDDETNAIRV